MPTPFEKKLNELKNPRVAPPDLGKLEGVYGISPAYVQRAAFVAVLSFLFFIAMMAAFYVRQNIGYFLLATAFLLVQLLTMFGWLMQRRAEFKLYEKGFSYRKNFCRWDEIKSLKISGAKRDKAELEKQNGEKVFLPETIHGSEQIIRRIEAEKIRNSRQNAEN